MFRSKLTFLVLVVVMGTIVGMMMGCDNESVTTFTDEPVGAAVVSWVETNQEILFDEEPGRDQVLMSNLSNSEVTWATSWLADQGYSYVDSNSIVMIEIEYEYISIDRHLVSEDRPSAQKTLPRDRFSPRLVRSDTLVWLAFENPTHDMANHTALLTHWRNGNEKQTILIELDISTEKPIPIREGSITGGAFEPEDTGLRFFWECMLAGGGGALLNCALSNCGYGACLGGAAAVITVTCAIGSFFN